MCTSCCNYVIENKPLCIVIMIDQSEAPILIIDQSQNASSSANYDVELFHVAEAHVALLGDTGDLPLTKKVSNGQSEAFN